MCLKMVGLDIYVFIPKDVPLSCEKFSISIPIPTSSFIRWRPFVRGQQGQNHHDDSPCSFFADILELLVPHD